MRILPKQIRYFTFRAITWTLITTFFSMSIIPPSQAQGQVGLPLPGTMVALSPAFAPVILKGVTVYPDNPLRFDFIIDTGDADLKDQALKDETNKLIKYFLASLTVPEQDLWVNLSPYEKDRIIPNEFGTTEMGRDLLAQDYILKQLTASLIYPENDLGKKFWDRVYKKIYEQYGTTEIPVNTFNKVWVVPDKAGVYKNGTSAFVTQAHLKVMLEEDYAALNQNSKSAESQAVASDGRGISTEILRALIIPEIEKEVNEGKNFIQLRQIYNSLILAVWFKRNLKESLLGKFYVGQNMVNGVDIQDKDEKFKIYEAYLEAYKKGVYNYIKEDYVSATQEVTPRKYFSGGMTFVGDRAMLAAYSEEGRSEEVSINHAMLVTADLEPRQDRDIQKLIKDIQKLEEKYRDVVMRVELPRARSFPEALFILQNMEYRFRKLIKSLDIYLNEKQLENTLLQQAFRNYRNEIETLHQQNQDVWVIYTALLWPEQRRAEAKYQALKTRADQIWSQWKLDSESPQNNLPAYVPGLLTAKQEVERATDFGESREAYRVLRESVLSAFRSHMTGFAHRLSGRFEVNLLAGVYKNLQESDPQKAKQWREHLLFVEGTDEANKRNIAGSLYGENPQFTPGIRRDVYRTVTEKVGSDLRRVLKKKNKRVVLSAALVTLLSVFGLKELTSPSANVLPDQNKKVVAVQKDSEKPVSPEKAAEETPKPESKPFEIAKIFLSVDKPLENPTVAKTELSPEVIAQLAALESQIQEQQKKMAALEKEESKIVQEVQGLQQKADQQSREFQQTVQNLEPMKPDQKPLTEPQEWHEPIRTAESSEIQIEPGQAQDLEIEGIAAETSELHIGVGNQPFGNVIARIQGGNGYLLTAQYSRMTANGKLFPWESHFETWTIQPGQTSFTEFVVIPSKGKNQIRVPIPPGYVVSGVLTEHASVAKYRVALDAKAGIWVISFDKDPGLVKVGIRPEEQPKEVSPLTFVNEQGQPLTNYEIEKVLQSYLSPKILSILQKAKTLPVAEKEKIINELMGVFNYTTNPLLNQGGRSVIQTIFQHYASECAGLSIARVMLSKLLEIPSMVQQGYLANGEMVYQGDLHQWQWTKDGIRESTQYVHAVSPLYKQEGVSTSQWQQEMDVLTSAERTAWIDRELDRIALSLDKQVLQENIQEIRRQKDDLQQKSKTSGKDAQSSTDYGELKYRYRLELEKLKSAVLDIQQIQDILAQLMRPDLVDLNIATDPYQLMAYGHYLFGVLNQLSLKIETQADQKIQDSVKARIELLKRDIFEELGKIAESKKWVLIEPDFSQSGISGNDDGGYHTEDYAPPLNVMRSMGNLDYLSDRMIVTSPAHDGGQVFLADHIDGVNLYAAVFNYSFTGPKAGEYANVKFGRYPGGDSTRGLTPINFYDYPFANDEWLAYSAYPDQKIQFIGPVAKRLGIEGKFFSSTSHKPEITHIHNKIIIRLEDNFGVRFVGEGAQALGLEGLTFPVADLPIQLASGKVLQRRIPGGKEKEIIAEYDPDLQNVKIVQSTVKRLERLAVYLHQLDLKKLMEMKPGDQKNILSPSGASPSGIETYTSSRWAVHWHYADGWGFYGDLRDPDLESIRVPRASMLEMPIEAPNGQLFCKVKINPTSMTGSSHFELRGAWAQNVGKHVRGSNLGPRWTDFNKGIANEDFNSIDNIVFFPSGHWVAKIGRVIGGNSNVWIGSPEILENYPFGDRSARDITEISQVYRTHDDRWLAHVKYQDGTQGYIGPLLDDLPELRVAYGAEIKGIDLPRVTDKSKVKIAFTQNPDGTIDPKEYAIIYPYLKEGSAVEKLVGPLAAVWGTKGDASEDSLRFEKNTEDGDVVISRYMMSTNALSAGSWNFLSRVVSLYGIDHHDSGYKIIPRRIDLRWENLKHRIDNYNRSASLKSDKKMDYADYQPLFIAWVDILRDMNADISGRYFNSQQVETAIRSMLLEENPYSQELWEIWKVDETYNRLPRIKRLCEIYHLEHLLPEILLKAYEVKKDPAVILTLITPEDWMQIVDKYAQKLRKNYGLPEDLFLVNFSWNEKAQKAIEELDHWVLGHLILSQPNFEQTMVDNLKMYREKMKSLKPIHDLIARNTIPPRDLTAEDLAGYFKFFHEYDAGHDTPFDAELRLDVRESSPYQLVSLLRADWPKFKIGWEHFSGYQERYANWQELNEELNQILGADFNGAMDENVLVEAIYEISHDGPALLLLILLTIIASNLALMKWSKTDRQLSPTAEKIISEIWKKNPWFSGEGHGEEKGAAELLKQVMAAGMNMTADQKNLLKEIRDGLDERGKMVVDAILLTALDAPERETQVSAKRLLGLLVPYFGATLVRQRPNFKKRQEMNTDLLTLVQKADANISPAEFYGQLFDILGKYSLIDDAQPQETTPIVLEPADLGIRIKEQLNLREKVIVHGPKLRDRRIGTSSTLRPSVLGGEMAGLREYHPDDPAHRIDWKATARRDEVIVRDVREDPEVSAAIVVDMRSLGENNINIWMDDLINSIKALYGQLRLGNGQADYQFQGIVFLLPDGRQEIKKLGEIIKQKPDFTSLFNAILQQVVEQYRLIFQDFKRQRSASKLNFYDAERNERYAERTEHVGSGLAEVQDLTKQLRAKFGVVKPVTFFLVGGHNDLTAYRDLAKQLVPAPTYTWDNNQARLINPVSVIIKSEGGKVDKAMLADSQSGVDTSSVGGIDLDPTDLNIQEQGTEIKINVPAIDLKTLENMNINGFTPIIIQIVPITNLPLIPGVQKKEAGLFEVSSASS